MSATVWLFSRPRRALSIFFLSWKVLLALVALSSPGLGYDTSTSLLEYEELPGSATTTPLALAASVYKFVRWDAVYYIQIASRGHVFEQEWAFGVAFSNVVAFLLDLLRPQTDINDLTLSTVTGVMFSFVAHWLSVILLYELANTSPGLRQRKIAFFAGLLHILSPAGMFLSAPYSESLFSLLNLLGHLLYRHGTRELHNCRMSVRDGNIVLAGLTFGFATMTRANGLFSGLPFLYDSLLLTTAILRGPVALGLIRRLACVICGGLLITGGMILPQYQAYREYCMCDKNERPRPWCTQTVPYMYGWVQQHYWNNGLFRYWTISNLPLFLLAAPMLLLLSFSAVDSLRKARSHVLMELLHGRSVGVDTSSAHDLVRMALPQLVLTIYAFVASHVQIITRLSSGYPLWYIWLATTLVQNLDSSRQRLNEKTVRFMVMYAIIQGGLYASFLPPA